MIDNVTNKVVNVDYRREVPVADRVDLADMPKIKTSTEELCAKLEISPVGGDLYNVVWGDGIFDTVSVFSLEDLDTRIAEDYEQRYNKIKELVAENPELKEKEEELIKKLDDTYEGKLRGVAMSFSTQYRSVTDFANSAGKHISDIYGVEFEEKEYLDETTKKEIESDFVNFFKHITSKIKDGASVEDIKDVSLSTNKHLKSFSDIRAVCEQTSQVTEFAFEVQRKAMNYALVGNISKEGMFSDLNSMLDSLDNKFSKFKLQGFGDGYIKNTFNFDKLMLAVKNTF